ncbi:sensor histidine kinase [Paenibacillus thermotolerans]|uniref:sensor histidine kinase n=1 Tax=Paenibacillus thermotolerans TaxID=3027807 RepID=UPI002368A90B|nr:MULTISPECIES: sensor histidine kinase [unclassified Paenibacillus]
MQKWHQIFHKSTGLSPYVWVVLYILPFYFIFRSSSPYEIAIGIVMIIAFFICYVLSFTSKGWLVYFWSGLQIAISVTMTLLFSYVYFSLFLAFFIGNIQNRIAFIVLYTVHLISTIATINYGFATLRPIFITQLPFVLICLFGVILLPVTTYNKNKQDRLQGQLEDANKRISELVKQEERQRIARDLHDTLGQKLSLIGLKSDLASKLIGKDPRRAEAEMKDVRQTARTALKEVRELVTQMRGIRIEDELNKVKQILKAAQIDCRLEGEPNVTDISLITENVVSMCLKEAVTNVVKHSEATSCSISFEPSRTELIVKVTDNGIGFDGKKCWGNGLRGMKERLEFVNGSMDIGSCAPSGGTSIVIKVPNMTQQPEQEAQL